MYTNNEDFLSLSNIFTFNFFLKLGTSTINKTELNIITILAL